MNPGYEERRAPRSLADMLGLTDHQEAAIVLNTDSRGIGSIVAPPSRLGSGVVVEAIASAGGGNSLRWGMPRGRYRGGSLGDWGSTNGSSGASGASGSPRRPPAPQQQLRYTSLLEIPDQPSHQQSAVWGVGVDDFPGEGEEYRQQEEELPSYEEAISQPPSNRVSVPLIAEAERQVPAPIRRDYRSTHNPQQSPPPIHTSVHPQPVIPPSPATVLGSPPPPHSSSRLTRLLRRRHSRDYIRPPPPQEGVPLELVCDKFGNRRRDIVLHGNLNGKLMWLGSLGDGGHSLPPTMGFSGRSVRWERRVLRNGGWYRCQRDW